MALGGLISIGANRYVDVVLNSDARTPQSSTDLVNPAEADDSTMGWFSLDDDVGGVRIYGRVPVGTTSIGTEPVIDLWGATSQSLTLTSGTPNDNREFAFERLDNPSLTAVGITIDFPATLSNTAAHNDNTYWFSALYPAVPIDVTGVGWIAAVVRTAAASLSANNALEIIGRFYPRSAA